MAGIILEDKKVSRAETDEIFANLKGLKQLKIYQRAGHENFLNKYRDEWINDIRMFVTAHDTMGLNCL